MTQAFNTATSMGRLTLNVLLSFAQFEREVTGERIRDKIAASKKKGMWMGGYPPLGYDVKDRKLVLNAAEAETVRCIFRRYQELGSVRLLKEHLDETGIVSKHRSRQMAGPMGANRLLGEPSTICCRTASIVARSFISIMPIQASTNRLSMRNFGRRFRRPWRQTESIGRRQVNHHLSLLAGLIYDALGESMTPSHAVKKGIRYRYYVSKSLLTGEKEATKGQRIPATHIEALVTGRIRTWLADPVAVLNAVSVVGPMLSPRRGFWSRRRDLLAPGGISMRIGCVRSSAPQSREFKFIPIGSTLQSIRWALPFGLMPRINGDLFAPGQMTESDI